MINDFYSVYHLFHDFDCWNYYLSCHFVVNQIDYYVVTAVDELIASVNALNDKYSTTYSDKAIRELRQNVGMVFQQYNLWPHLTVQQNLIEAPCRVLGLSKDQALARAEKLLERLRLKPYSDRYPLHLSGGQQQRVAIARAYVNHPQDRKSTRLNSSHSAKSRMPSSA